MPRQLKCECGDCRACKHRVYMREYLRRNPEKNDRSRWYRENSDRVKAGARERRRAAPKPVKRAQDAVAKALKRGALVRPDTCARCSRACKPVGHHADYSKPLEVEWLCRSCHAREHSPHA